MRPAQSKDDDRLLSERVLVLAPTLRDAQLCRTILAEAGMTCVLSADVPGLCRDLAEGAGAAVLTEEALHPAYLARLVDALDAQPTWSDFPLLILTREGANSEVARASLEQLGNVTLIERPVRVGALVSAVRAALRARRRQYLIRDHLEQQARAAAALAESEWRRRQLADNLPQGFIYQAIRSADGNARFSYVSAGVERILGVTPAEATADAMALYGLIAPEDQERVMTEEEASVREEKPFDCRFRSRSRQGGIRWLHCRSAPRPLEGGGTVWDGIAMDVTVQVRAEEELGRLYEVADRRATELKEADRRKDEFLAMLAHELRNPLAPVRNALHILASPKADKAMIERARHMMERQVVHLVRLVDDLLDVSRIMRDKIELRREPVLLQQVIERAVETALPLFESQRHHFELKLTPVPLCVDADPVRLAQVIGNLLQNAAKYTESGGRIALEAVQVGDAAEIHVRDNGVGIDPQAASSIFDLFVQVDRSIARSQGGLGIGLTLVKRLVAMHGGTVQAFSEGLGKGSEFVIRLPLLSTKAPAPPQPPAHRDGAKWARRRVLVVDDNVDSAESVAMILRLLNQEVHIAHTGPDALSAAKRLRPDLMLLDIGLPGLSGYDVASQMRQSRESSRTLLVAMTGYGQEEARRRSQEAGFDHHLVKPIDPMALERLLGESVGDGAVVNRE